MKTTPLLLSLSLLACSPLAMASAMPHGDVYLAAEARQTQIPAAEYQGHLLPALLDYHYCLQRQAQGQSAQGLVLRRRMAFDIARRYPAEVNDQLQRADGSWATPLSLAVQAQDKELVDMLLRLGALPFSTNAAFPLTELQPLAGITPKPEVTECLRRARMRYNPLNLLLNKQQATPAAQNDTPADTMGPTQRHLAETQENTYLCEPGKVESWLLYEAYRHLGNRQGTLLRLQPIARSVVQPEGRKRYGTIITTARVVDALTGILPTCEFITWKTPHEGPIRDEEKATHVAENAAPVFFHLTPRMLEHATQEEQHLKLGMLDPFDICHGEEWQAAFDRVLADYPELHDATPATAEALAAARQLLEEAPVIVRASIFRYHTELDEAAGLVHVRCHATLRDPHRGGIIKGALRDWGTICYKRSFPISDEWRQHHADNQAGKNSEQVNIPVILALAPTDSGEEDSCWVFRNARQPMKVLQALDAVHDADLLRALNEIVFRPGKVIEP